LEGDNLEIQHVFYVLQDFATFAFQKFNKFDGLKMLLKAMRKIIIDGNKHRFNFKNQTQTTLIVNNQVGAMNHVVDIAHKWNMFLHELNGNTTFNTMKNRNLIYTKAN
jgi:hypothetical protein